MNDQNTPDSRSYPYRTDNAQRAKAKAEQLYPLETWEEREDQIFIAGSRQVWSKNQKQILEKELIQARILIAMGSTVYFLPDRGDGKHPDAVVDGVLVEFKTITGTIRQIEERFKESRKQAETVFLKIDADLTQEAVLRKLIDKIRKSNYCGGMVIAHFTETGKTYFWEVDSLK